jgi:hypothetical protein
MTRARNQLISLETTPYYHTISRCVRRAFLCGEDSLTGKNHEHRKQWVLTRLRELSEVFAIDICAYAILSNHYHLVLRVNQAQAQCWSKTQVTERWENSSIYTMLLHVLYVTIHVLRPKRSGQKQSSLTGSHD